jgi:hypothetical protein
MEVKIMPSTRMEHSESQSSWSGPVRWFLLLLNLLISASIPLNLAMLSMTWQNLNWMQILFQIGALVAATAFLLGEFGLRSFLANSRRRTGKLVGRLWTLGIVLIVCSFLFNAKGMWDHKQCMDRGGNWDRATVSCNK